MKLYEVIFWGSHGDGDAEDTIYFVRAPDFRAAVDDVQRNASASHHNGERAPLAHVVYEVGTDLSPCADSNARILRGPYFAYAYNLGWKAWHRKIEDSDYTNEWEEESQIAEPDRSRATAGSRSDS
jgi:hypothetical protein